MTGHELRALLDGLAISDPDLLRLPIATHANNHTTSYRDGIRLAVVGPAGGTCLLLGNVSKRNLNMGDRFVITGVLDGGSPLPMEWWRPGGQP